MHSSFTPTGSTNAQLMGVEKRSQFLGSKRVSTLGSQPPQSESIDNWTDASSFLIESQQASTKENWGSINVPCVGHKDDESQVHLPILLSISDFFFLVFLISTFQFLVPCGRLSSVMTAFEHMLK